MSTPGARNESAVIALIGGVSTLIGAGFLFGLTAHKIGIDRGTAALVRKMGGSATYTAHDVAWDYAYFGVAGVLALVGAALVVWAVLRYRRAARSVGTMPDQPTAVHA
ncbi:hypothetical protein [Gryllotalpicola koreensis]|uniref:MFS transporter n=1 Tax=Gryllotalpicola koreensis TaxID=993086 RepID=A0ABP8A396_9MICO